MSPQEEIERLKEIIKKKDCLLELRRKQAREYRQKEKINAERIKHSMGGLEKALSSLYGSK